MPNVLTTLYMPHEVKELAKQIAHETHLTPTAVMRNAILSMVRSPNPAELALEQDADARAHVETIPAPVPTPYVPPAPMPPSMQGKEE